MVKNYIKADITAYSPCLSLLDFSNFLPNIFTTLLATLDYHRKFQESSAYVWKIFATRRKKETKLAFWLPSFFACSYILSWLPARTSYSHGCKVQNLSVLMLSPHQNLGLNRVARKERTRNMLDKILFSFSKHLQNYSQKFTKICCDYLE